MKWSLHRCPDQRKWRPWALGEESILEGASAGTIYVDLSTSSPSSTRRIYQEYKAKGIRMLDAPVSGGVTGAENASLSIMVGGDREVFDEVAPVLGCIGENIIILRTKRKWDGMQDMQQPGFYEPGRFLA